MKRPREDASTESVTAGLGDIIGRRREDDDSESDHAVDAEVARATGLGDIMGGARAEPSTLEDFTPLQRVVLSANGNLQRLVSSYYNAPVTVNTRYSNRVSCTVIEREVELCIFGSVFGVATSSITFTRAELSNAVEHRGVAIGQLFWHFHLLPRFDLREAGHLAPASLADNQEQTERFFRHYDLSAEGVVCNIREVLRSDLFALSSEAMPARLPAAPPIVPSMGDIMSPNKTFLELPSGFTRLQRLLLTANGNVERILSSYFAQPLQLHVHNSHKRNASVYDRQSAMFHQGRQVMLAKTTAFLTLPEWRRAMDSGAVDLGSLFAHFSELPSFTLHSTGVGEGFFWRQYRLQASGMTCEINETFPSDVFDGAAAPPLPYQTASVEHHGF